MSDKETKKKSAIAAATEHYRNKIGGELQKYRCEEWNLDIYYKATASLATENKIMGLQQNGKTAEALCESIIQKAFDENGKRLFVAADREELMNEADPQVIIKIAGVLNNANSDSIEDIAKN
jgi:hypothetical protein